MLEEAASHILVVPNGAGEAFRSTDLPIKKGEFKDFEDGKWPRIYVYGRVIYKTVFKEIVGETVFCRVWFPKPKGSFVGCPGHPDTAK